MNTFTNKTTEFGDCDLNKFLEIVRLETDITASDELLTSLWNEFQQLIPNADGLDQVECVDVAYDMMSYYEDNYANN